MNLSRVVSLFLTCLVSFPAVSAPFPDFSPPEKVGVDIGSWHSKPGFNNVNPGAYAIWKGGYLAGAYFNSYERPTVHAGKLWSFGESGTFGLYTGLGTGYDWALTPLIAPSVKLPLGGNVSARITAMLDPRPDTAQAFHLSVEWPI